MSRVEAEVHLSSLRNAHMEATSRQLNLLIGCVGWSGLRGELSGRPCMADPMTNCCIVKQVRTDGVQVPRGVWVWMPAGSGRTNRQGAVASVEPLLEPLNNGPASVAQT